MAAWNWQSVPDHVLELITRDQAGLVKDLRRTSSMTALAKERGVAERGLWNLQKRTKLALVAAGYDPERGMTETVSHQQSLQGRSAYVKIDPETGQESVTAYWQLARKTPTQDALEQFADTLALGIKASKPVPLAKKVQHDSNLMSGIFIGDAHLGMYAYAPETRHSDFDSNIAATQLRAAIDNLILRSPDSEIGLLVNVGDYMHSDSGHNQTTGGTPLDVDTRHERVMDIAAAVMSYAIDQMLRKFKRVVVVNAKGNHDTNASVAIQKIMAAWYRNEPRVDILRTAGFFHYIEWGKWLIGINHGDKIKATKLPGVMAREMSEAWGRTKSRMWALGHFHHQEVLELDGCTVQKFAALPPPDSWHAGVGHSSIQAMQMIVFKKTGGRHSTLIYEIERPTNQPDITL